MEYIETINGTTIAIDRQTWGDLQTGDRVMLYRREGDPLIAGIGHIEHGKWGTRYRYADEDPKLSLWDVPSDHPAKVVILEHRRGCVSGKPCNC